MRYLLLLGVQLRTSLLLAMQYRADFFLDGFVEIFWMATAIAPLYIVFQLRSSVAGWTFADALLVMGWFTFLQGILEGAINPSLANVVEHIRKGTLDFVLVKPADAQFLISTARFLPWRAVNILTALLIFAWAFHLQGHAPGALAVCTAVFAMVAAVTALYSLWILTVSAAFFFVRVDNLSQLFIAVFDAARWPINVFRGLVRGLFTFVIPLALMTTYPAKALLGTLPASTFAVSMAGAALLFVAARLVWNASIARYTSAGG
jgi:ABC-2 type transport system permease protein